MTVYILECSDGSYYTGVTNNIERRFKEHESGLNKTCYTFTRRPLKLAFYMNFQSPLEAIFWEKKIKRWSRNKKKAIIEGNWEDLHDYSKCSNKTSHLNFVKDDN
jgi:putative endonuclease